MLDVILLFLAAIYLIIAVVGLMKREYSLFFVALVFLLYSGYHANAEAATFKNTERGWQEKAQEFAENLAKLKK